MMRDRIAPNVAHTEFPPIAEAMSWIKPGASNRELLNMCQAVPSYPPAEKLQAEIARLAHEPTTGGYTDIFGIAPLRQAFAGHIAAEYDGNIEASAVAITTGCNQAFAATIMAIAKPGDNVIIPAPFYFNHQMWLNMLGIEIRPISAFPDGNSHPNPQHAAELIDANTKAIILCSPNNPTGAIYPPQVLAQFYDAAQSAGISLVLDETYKDFRANPAPPHDLFGRENWQDTLIYLYSFSKSYALAGYRLGALIAGPEIIHQVAKVLDCMTVCPPHIAQRAVLFALTELDDWKAEKKALMRDRLSAIQRSFQTVGLKYELISSGAYFAYVKHPFGLQTSKEVAKRLAGEHDVLCLPGAIFGPGQESYLRLAFANVDASRMVTLAERLIESQD